MFTVVIHVASSFQELEQCAIEFENVGTGNSLSDLLRSCRFLFRSLIMNLILCFALT